jgi:hypothetical protein
MGNVLIEITALAAAMGTLAVAAERARDRAARWLVALGSAVLVPAWGAAREMVAVRSRGSAYLLVVGLGMAFAAAVAVRANRRDSTVVRWIGGTASAVGGFFLLGTCGA